MPDGRLGPLVQHLRRLVGGQFAGGLTDAQLLERWLALRDEAAFEVLMWRHGPMVLAVCARMLPCRQDVEDAFQATMLIFLRKVGSVRKAESIGSWLYKVAYRVSTRARARSAVQTGREHHGIDLEELAARSEPCWDRMRGVLDDEITKLPAKYRAAFVLCYLEGKTNEEAAHELGCPVGTIFSRLDGARKRLRARLVELRASSFDLRPEDRGVGQKSRLSSLSNVALMDGTIKACLSIARNPAAASGISMAAIKLTEGVLQTMFLKKVGVLTAAVLVVAALGTSVEILRHRTNASEPPVAAAEPVLQENNQQAKSAPDGAAKKQPVARADNLIDVPSRHDGVLLFVGTPRAGKEGSADIRRLRVGDKVKKGQVLAQLDPTLAEADVRIAEAKVVAAHADLGSSMKTRDEAQRRFQTQEVLFKSHNTSTEDHSGAKLAYDRYVYEVKSKEAAIEVAKLEVQRAQAVLATYTIRTPQDGVIKYIFKHAGEGVRYLEPVLQIEISEEER